MSSQTTGSPGWKGPGGDAGHKAEGAGRTLALKIEQSVSWPTLDEWPAEQKELLKNHASSYPLQESQNFKIHPYLGIL